MKEKCEKYEGLFVFADEATFLEHIESCEDCKAEHKKMQKVSELIQEAKPYIKRCRARKAFSIKAACACFIMLATVLALQYVNRNTEFIDVLTYGTTFDAQTLGFPVDEYGLIKVE